MKKYIILALLLTLYGANAMAQCAMCKATISNNVSNGQNIGAGVNAGIIYLAAFPYLILAFIGYFWYRNSQKNVKKRLIALKK